ELAYTRVPWSETQQPTSLLLHLLDELHQRAAQFFDLVLVLRVLEGAVVVECLISMRQIECLWNDNGLDVREDRARGDRRADGAECAGRRRHQRADLAVKLLVDTFALDLARKPIDGVLQSTGDRAVVLGRREQEAIVFVKKLLEPKTAFRLDDAVFEIAV